MGDVSVQSPSERFLKFNLFVLPFASYLSLVGLGSMILVQLWRSRRLAVAPWLRNGFLGLTLLMLLSGAVAFNQGEAFLQLANFLPFFLLFGILPLVVRSLTTLEEMAIALVLPAIPISFIALVEYGLKSSWIPRAMRRTGFVKWVRSAPHKGRAMVMFEHPNALASYLVLILGFALGLVLHRWLTSNGRRPNQPKTLWNTVPTWMIALAAGMALIGIFCTGSRNGLLVAVVQLGFFVLMAQANRRVVFAVLLSIAGLAMSALLFGLGDRRIAAWDWRNDPRMGVWAIAVEMIQERPWLGWGLGNFKFIYPDRMPIVEFKEIFHPHNLWLLLGSEMGLPAMILLTALIAAVAYQAVFPWVRGAVPLAMRGVWAAYLLAGVALLLYALFDVTFYDSRVNVVNWVTLSGLYILPRFLSKSTKLETRASNCSDLA